MIDAHQHFWQLDKPFEYGWLQNPDLAAINHDYLPADLKRNIDEVGITHTVFVQTQHNVEENRWVLDMAKDNSFIAGVVGWVDLASEACEDQLAEFKDNPKFVGIRHITQDEPDDDFIVRPEVLRGLKVLEKHQVPFDLLFYVKHLKHADTVAKTVPNLPLVIDHLAKPRIKDQSIDDWLPQFKAAAACDNIHCKLSGMITEADWHHWKPTDLKPYVDQAMELFGPDRCMFGSDWPVCELAGSYTQVFDAINEVLGELSESERQKIFHDNAKKFYSLQLQD